MRRLLPLMPALGGCLLGPAPDDGAAATFDAVWSDFDAHYALFGVKQDVDWDALGTECRRLLPADDADEQALLSALQCLLAPLGDDHVRILRPQVEDGLWSAGRLELLELTDFSEDVSGSLVVDLVDDHPAVRWGWLDADFTGRSDLDLGYLHVRSLGSSSTVDAVDRAMDALAGADGLVLDLRVNGGGLHSVLEPVAAHFADRQFVYSHIRRRDGQGRTSYGNWLDYDVEPGDAPFLGPVALVTHAFTVSGAENLTLALRELDHVTHVGSPTAGAFSAAMWRDAPNGWLYALSVEDVRDAAGASHEGVGLLPQQDAESTLEQTQAGVDRALEVAVDVLGEALGP